MDRTPQVSAGILVITYGSHINSWNDHWIIEIHCFNRDHKNIADSFFMLDIAHTLNLYFQKKGIIYIHKCEKHKTSLSISRAIDHGH